MDFFDDLNPFLVRQDGAASEMPPTGMTGPSMPQTSATGSNTGTTSTPTTTGATPPPTTSGTPTPSITPPPIIDQSYVENILRLNIGKLGTFYFTYTGSLDWRDRIYKGILEQAGRDHFVVREQNSQKRYLLQLVYFDWAEFDEEIDYQYPYQ